ncbi:MAG: hypothetical protein QOH06_1952 [Acidobacteriota bacterium]|jgi:hypothetical protein|nr:hypothetical protein [Acidobacteriota bacterium]
MDKLVRQVVLGAVLSLTVLSLGGPVAAQPLPTPGQFVRFLDIRCYDIPDQPPLNVPLLTTHLNPVLINAGAPAENVFLQEPEDLCVPVRKNAQVVPPASLPFLQYADLKCYRITGQPLNLTLQLSQLNPAIAALYGANVNVIVREPQQLCVPVAKNDQFAPPEVLNLIKFLDIKCYRVDAPQIVNQPINLTHLNPLFSGTPTEQAKIFGPTPQQLCVPVAKNNQFPNPAAVAQIIRYSDVLCYNLAGLPLDRQLKLTHLNPVLRAMGLPPEDVKVTESTKLCVPVAKNGMFPPG